MNQINDKIIKETKSLIVRTEKLVEGFKVNSQPTLIKANEYLTEITQAEKQVIERERQILDPLNEAKKSIMDFFRPFKEKLIHIKWQLKKESAEYLDKLEAIEIQKKAEIEKKVAEGKLNIDKAFEKIQKFEEKKDAVIVREERIVEIIDESKIPDKYWVLDMVAIRRDTLNGTLTEKDGVKVAIRKNIIGKKV